jgi:hypothetical protein
LTEKSKKPPSFRSAPGAGRYVRLDKADYGTDKFPKPKGEFSTQLIFEESDPEFQAMIAKLKPAFEEAVREGEAKFAALKIEQRKKLKTLTVNELYSVIYDPETEKPTGKVFMKFATAASYEDKKTGQIVKKKPPEMFDARGNRMKPIQIWGGSILKVNFTPSAYFVEGTGSAGLKLYLNAVQVIDLVQGGQRAASDYGFGEEEGYVHDDSKFEDETSGDSAADDAADDAADF